MSLIIWMVIENFFIFIFLFFLFLFLFLFFVSLKGILAVDRALDKNSIIYREEFLKREQFYLQQVDYRIWIIKIIFSLLNLFFIFFFLIFYLIDIFQYQKESSVGIGWIQCNFYFETQLLHKILYALYLRKHFQMEIQ